jgi:hypothetical protein
MAAAYEIRDSHTPGARGQRFNSLDRAARELGQAVGAAGRFELVNRETGAVIARNRGTIECSCGCGATMPDNGRCECGRPLGHD